jgi:hypothetical protein
MRFGKPSNAYYLALGSSNLSFGHPCVCINTPTAPRLPSRPTFSMHFRGHIDRLLLAHLHTYTLHYALTHYTDIGTYELPCFSTRISTLILDRTSNIVGYRTRDYHQVDPEV